MAKKTNVIPMPKEVEKLLNKYKLTIEWLGSLSGEITEKDFIDRFPYTVDMLKTIGEDNLFITESVKSLNDLVSEKAYDGIEHAIELEEMFKVNQHKSPYEVLIMLKELM